MSFRIHGNTGRQMPDAVMVKGPHTGSLAQPFHHPPIDRIRLAGAGLGEHVLAAGPLLELVLLQLKNQLIRHLDIVILQIAVIALFGPKLECVAAAVHRCNL